MKTIMRYFKNWPVPMLLFCFVLFVGFFTACSKDDDDDMGSTTTVSYTGTFEKSSDAVTTSATGSVSGTFNATTMMLSYSANWSGLGSNAAAMHFHDAGPILEEITGFPDATSGSVSGTISLTTAQASDLGAGKIYIQIHTSGYPSGEILATFERKSSGGGGSGGGGGY
ncbi:CHRD domain-containing protein [Mangrovibacterium lignilyticum]|uniref:CHRD domain-containing protein n=1 Tax=Mangrovibacterium lignilyticum TaxID=2668052 RepID=UPI0013D698FC|nr:CHRD domain-containing protein [Mangrovibacterium lignilyticum]